jgi:hypothetical protein
MKAIRYIGWLVLLTGAFAQQKSEATITVNLENGATIKGIVRVVARVQSEKLVERVEFQVDGALREVDDSTPLRVRMGHRHRHGGRASAEDCRLFRGQSERYEGVALGD